MESATKWKWRPDLWEEWNGAVGTAQVQEVWDSITSEMPADEAVGLFRQGLELAVEAVHQAKGRVVVDGKGPKRHGRPANGWFDDSCRAARETWRRACDAQGQGPLTQTVVDARQAYRRAVRAAKRRHEAQRRESMAHSLYQDPRRFWSRYKGRDSRGTMFSVEEWSEHFSTLFGANTARGYEGGCIDSHCSAFADLFPAATEQAREAAACLNKEFSVEELQTAMTKLANHKAAGVDGMPAEFLREAFTPAPGGGARAFTLAPVIVRIFNAVLRGGYPTAWQTSALAPVPKPKGRPDVKGDYRGIAVGPVLGKLYSAIWTTRIDAWAEKQGLRASGQAGFRAGRGTPDNCFVLRHAIDKAALTGKPLYCAFIDFSKAYDRVDRALLLRILEGCGVHGAAQGAIASMFEVARMQVRAEGRLGRPFDCKMGVKQGCPASPVFFGILIDRLEAYLARHCPAAGLPLASQMLRALLYADDVVLMAESAAQLQTLLDKLTSFCEGNSMFVNSDKSAVVVYGARGPVRANFHVGNTDLPKRDSYVYLGLTFANGVPTRSALDGAVTKAKRAMHAMFARCYKLGLHNVNLQGHLFDSLVKPVLCYGCEVWGVDWVSRMCERGAWASGRADVEVHLPFVRQSLGVNTTTSVAAMLRELHRQPTGMFWLRMTTQLWNRALGREPGDCLRAALEENVCLALDTRNPLSARRRLWAHHLTQCFDRLGIPWRAEFDAGDSGGQAATGSGPETAGSRAGVGDGGRGPVVSLAKVDLNLLQQRMESQWTANEWAAPHAANTEAWTQQPCAVRAAPAAFSKGFKLFTYERWFAVDVWERKSSWMFHLQNPQHIRVTAQFRLGSHWLQIEQGRHAKPKQRRGQRTCQWCSGQGRREDEAHLLECPHYTELRARLMPEFEAGWDYGQFKDADVRAVFTPTTGEGWSKLAEFLLCCRQLKMG